MGVYSMKKTVFKVVSLLLVCCMLISLMACGNKVNDAVVKVDNEILNLIEDEIINNGEETNTNSQKDSAVKQEEQAQQNASVSKEDSFAPKGDYNKGVVLVKVKESFSEDMLGNIDFISAEALYKGSKWYSVKLANEEKTEEAVEYLAKLDTFEKVDYDYIMGVAIEDEAKVTDNPDYDKQTNLGLHNIPYGWTQNGKHPGGSSDVVIAVIDTGVDYNHLDLRNNIWINTSEIPDNYIDDDNNGYIDDVYGWDCVSDDNDPMDDNGHGTHVAGIIAAENNKIGGIGVAYNCKVMVLKAGNSSGYFNNSDIAEAVQYAYMNGASVINMSFGGSNISVAVEDALENAYNTSVLVAAAGNDSACNDISCSNKMCVKSISYPAALPYVIGVMSTDASGNNISAFSNYDHKAYDSVEYEVYAVGEAVKSTWPNNKYATLNGTSMAAPTVAGIAALLRSHFSDREVYSTKFIQSQIVNTGSINPFNNIIKESDVKHSVADVQDALTKLPKPNVNLYDYSIDDSASINKKNNGNGVIDAGETVHLCVSLHNRGGVATNVKVTADTKRNGDFTDPYFNIVNSQLLLSDIGTYSVRNSGDKYFEIIVSENCPNDYLVDFNISFTYENGLDEKDKTVYSGNGKATFNVSSGYHLPATITQDTTFTNDRLYIVGEDVVIPNGVTVTFEEGCEIQFYDDREYYNSPVIRVFGTLNMLGTKENMVVVHPSERYSVFACLISNSGTLNLSYVNAMNLITGIKKEKYSASTTISDSWLKTNTNNDIFSRYLYFMSSGTKYSVISVYNLLGSEGVAANIARNCNTYFYRNYIECDYSDAHIGAETMDGNTFIFEGDASYRSFAAAWANNNTFFFSNAKKVNFEIIAEAKNNRFVTVNNDLEDVALLDLPSSNTENNEFSAIHKQYASQIVKDYYDSNGNPKVDVYASCSDISVLWPYVKSVELLDKNGDIVTTVGKEEIKVRVTFNKAMDTTKDTFVTFGTIEPYADYRIYGEYISDTVWEGTYTLKAQIENGQNFIKVNNACAAEDQTKTLFGEYQLHEFTIDTTAAMSMNLQAEAFENGIKLNFVQDDYETLLGYNIYRSEEKDGNYVKLNNTILLPEENEFIDENAEPGKTYWYTYTVVLSDFSESTPAGKVFCTAMDTLSPTLYHTPVNQGYKGNNLVISCLASDNMKVESVTLYYRSKGAESWKSIDMSKQNDKYSATIFGSELDLVGLEYYIVATDGINIVLKGTEENPYSVVIKEASAISRLGDVDGNGSVTTKDALMLMQCLNGDLILSDDAFKRADLNGDTVLSSVEALRILQYINGKVNTLAM